MQLSIENTVNGELQANSKRRIFTDAITTRSSTGYLVRLSQRKNARSIWRISRCAFARRMSRCPAQFGSCVMHAIGSATRPVGLPCSRRARTMTAHADCVQRFAGKRPNEPISRHYRHPLRHKPDRRHPLISRPTLSNHRDTSQLAPESELPRRPTSV